MRSSCLNFIKKMLDFAGVAWYNVITSAKVLFFCIRTGFKAILPMLYSAFETLTIC